MIVPFTDGGTGTAVYINPAWNRTDWNAGAIREVYNALRT